MTTEPPTSEDVPPLEKMARSVDTLSVLFRAMVNRMIPLQAVVALLQFAIVIAFGFALQGMREQQAALAAMARTQAETKAAAEKTATELEDRAEIEVRPPASADSPPTVVIRPPATSSAPTVEVPLRFQDAKSTSAAGGGGTLRE